MAGNFLRKFRIGVRQDSRAALGYKEYSTTRTRLHAFLYYAQKNISVAMNYKETSVQTMTLEQLRAASDAGGVSSVTLKAQGGAFFVQISTRSGSGAVLAKARTNEPRRFGNPLSALNVLRDIGITVGKFDASEYDPTDKEHDAGNRGRANAMREAHEAAAYGKWLAAEIQASIDDPRPSLPHDEVVAEMEADIAALPAARKKRA